MRFAHKSIHMINLKDDIATAAAYGAPHRQLRRYSRPTKPDFKKSTRGNAYA